MHKNSVKIVKLNMHVLQLIELINAPAVRAAVESAVQVDTTLLSADNFLRDVRPQYPIYIASGCSLSERD